MSLFKNVTADEVKIFKNRNGGDLSTTGTGFLEAVKLTFTAEAADYLIWYSAELRSTHSQARVNVKVEVDGATILAENNEIPNPLDGYGTFSGCEVVTLTAASHDIAIDFSSSQIGKDVHVRRASLVAMKVVQ